MKLPAIRALIDAAPEPSPYYFRHRPDPENDPGYQFWAFSRTLVPKLLAVATVVEHALELGYFAEDSSTGHWMREAFAALEAAKI